MTEKQQKAAAREFAEKWTLRLPYILMTESECVTRLF